MEYRRFGRTELLMPVLTFGCMRFQESWERGHKVSAASQSNLEKIVEHALALGINHFETARGYGTSEEQLGHVLPGLDRRRIIVQTKVGPRPTAAEYRRDVEDSMKTLGVDRLDLLALHGVNNRTLLDKALVKGGSLEALVKLKEEGITSHIGFSAHGGPDIHLEAIRTGVFDYVNLWYSYIFQDTTPVLIEAQRRDMGILIISPNDKGGKLYDPPEKLRRLTSPLTPMQFNDLFTLQRPEINTLSIGARAPADFDEHAAAVAHAAEWRPAMREAAGRLDTEWQRALGSEWARHYQQGLPSWDKTPGEINIPVILWLLNLAKAFDMVEYGKMRYNLLGGGAHWFPGCKADQLDKLDLAAMQSSVKKSPFADRIIEALREADVLLGGKTVKRLGGAH